MLTGAFVFGIFLGIIGTFTIFSIMLSISRGSEKLEKRTRMQHEIMMPYSLLYQLRQNKYDAAIEILEGELDNALLNLAYAVEHDIITMNPEIKLSLVKNHQYRQEYPREYKDDAVKEKIKTIVGI